MASPITTRWSSTSFLALIDRRRSPRYSCKITPLPASGDAQVALLCQSCALWQVCSKLAAVTARVLLPVVASHDLLWQDCLLAALTNVWQPLAAKVNPSCQFQDHHSTHLLVCLDLLRQRRSDSLIVFRRVIRGLLSPLQEIMLLSSLCICILLLLDLLLLQPASGLMA